MALPLALTDVFPAATTSVANNTITFNLNDLPATDLDEATANVAEFARSLLKQMQLIIRERAVADRPTKTQVLTGAVTPLPVVDGQDAEYTMDFILRTTFPAGGDEALISEEPEA
jgi:hypothetical protein